MSVSKWIGRELERLHAQNAASHDDDEQSRDLGAFLSSRGWDLNLEERPFNRDEIYEDRLRELELRRLQPISRKR